MNVPVAIPTDMIPPSVNVEVPPTEMPDVDDAAVGTVIAPVPNVKLFVPVKVSVSPVALNVTALLFAIVIAEPLVLLMVPDAVTVKAPVPSAVALLILMVPLPDVNVVPPVKVLLPESVRTGLFVASDNESVPAPFASVPANVLVAV